MKKQINCLNTKALLDYINQQRSGSINKFLKNIDPEIDNLKNPELFLTDINNWISCETAKNIFEKARKFFKDEEIVYKASYNSIINQRLGYIQTILLMAFGSPKVGLIRAQEVNDKFNTTKDIETEFIGRNKAIIRLKWFKNIELSKDFCRMNKGIYTAIPSIWKLPPAKLIETKCFFEGDPHCEYHVEWEDHNFIKNIFFNFITRKNILRDALEEVGRDKELLQVKYEEISDLNLSLQKKIEQLKAIQSASQVIVSLNDQKNLIDTTMNILTNVLRFDRAVVFLIDEEKSVLRFEYGVGEKDELKTMLSNYEIPLSRMSNAMVRVASTGVPIVIEDVDKAPLNKSNQIIKLFKPKSFVIVPLITHKKVIGILAADRIKDESRISEDDKEYLITFANQIAISIENSRLYNDLKSSYLNSVKALVQALEAKDSYTRGHSERVTYYAVKIAEKMQLPRKFINHITHMSILHDIGKIGISENILRKSEKLNDEEFFHIKTHPEIGEKILSHINFFNSGLLYIRHHHERYDGYGYPDGLSGRDIPVGARIICVADSYDAMTSDRPYRKGMATEAAIQEIIDNTGSQFDPEVAEAFIQILKEENIF
jgi:HD-GYP domain-containing protein (c-di-GMP phosphodiesterase class II)